MRKLLSFALAWLFAVTAFASPGTDTIDMSFIGVSTNDDFTGEKVGTTGAKYQFTNVRGWWDDILFLSENNSFITVTESAGKVASVKRLNGTADQYTAVYVSNSPITADNLSSAAYLGQIAWEESLTPTEDYTYIAFTLPEGATQWYGTLEVTWAEASTTPEPGEIVYDHLSTANIMAQNPDGNFSATSYMDRDAKNASMTYVGESGTSYYFDQLISNGQWWTVDWDSSQGYVNHAEAPAGYITSIKFDMDWYPSYFSFIVSDTPILPNDKYAAGNKQVTMQKNADGTFDEWKPDGIYKYFFLSSAQERINDIVIGWSQTRPAIQVKTPTIDCYEDPIAPGSEVSIYSPTSGSTLHIEAYINGEKDDNSAVEYSDSQYCTFVLPGKVGDEVEVRAYATKDEYVDSEVASKVYTLATPKAKTPEVPYINALRPGEDITVTSATPGAVIYWTYSYINYNNRDEDQVFEEILSAPSPATITCPVDAPDGLVFEINVYAGAEGYVNSDTARRSFNIRSGKLYPPTFDIEGGKVPAGTIVTITKSEGAAKLGYQFDNGNWQDWKYETTEENTVQITIDEDCTLSAWCETADSEYDLQSETVRYEFTILRPAVLTGDNITPANLKAQNPDANFSATGYTDHAAVNATMAYTGTSGAEYTFDQVIANDDIWTLDWNYPDPQGYMYNTKDGGYISSVKFDLNYVEDVNFFVSDKPLTNANKYDGVQVTLQPENGVLPEWKADGIYKYFYLNSAQRQIKDLNIVWSDQEPELSVKTPTINCYASRTIPGSTVNVSTLTAEATLHVDVYVNDVKHEGTEEAPTSTVVNASNYSFALPGKAGDTVKVTAYASKEGYTDSEEATQTYTLVLPQTAQPYLQDSPWEVVPGQQVTLVCETEGADISYQYGLIDENDNNNDWYSQQLIGKSPVSITVPETAKPEMSFFVRASALADGYDESNMFETNIKVMSNVLEAPTFNIESGKEVIPGTKVSISRTNNSTTLHYIINKGEEQTTTEYYVQVPINEDMTIEAWVSGDAPYKDSEKVTATYTIEKLGENTDAIYPTMFSDNITDDSYAYSEYAPAKGATTGFEYVYNGGMRNYFDANCFYLDSSSDGGARSILYNKEGRKILRIKFDTSYPYGGCYVQFSSEAPITEVTAAMEDYDYVEGRLRISDDENAGYYKFGDWIDLSEAAAEYEDPIFKDAKYFAVYHYGQNSYVSRVVVEYEADDKGIDSITVFDGVDAIYDINGVKMNPDMRLAPGIYIRIVDGKAEKFVVK